MINSTRTALLSYRQKKENNIVRMFICILCLLFVNEGVVLAQYGGPTWSNAESKQSSKQQKKLEKERKQQEKEQAKAANEALRSIEIDAQELSLFPQNFAGRTLRIKYVFLGEMQTTVENGQTFYLVQIRRGETAFFNFPLPNKVLFVTDEAKAFEIHTYYRDKRAIFNDSYPAHVMFDLIKGEDKGQPYYIARITCIDFINGLGNKLKKVGQCT